MTKCDAFRTQNCTRINMELKEWPVVWIVCISKLKIVHICHTDNIWGMIVCLWWLSKQGVITPFFWGPWFCAPRSTQFGEKRKHNFSWNICKLVFCIWSKMIQFLKLYFVVDFLPTIVLCCEDDIGWILICWHKIVNWVWILNYEKIKYLENPECLHHVKDMLYVVKSCFCLHNSMVVYCIKNDKDPEIGDMHEKSCREFLKAGGGER